MKTPESAAMIGGTTINPKDGSSSNTTIDDRSSSSIASSGEESTFASSTSFSFKKLIAIRSVIFAAGVIFGNQLLTSPFNTRDYATMATASIKAEINAAFTNINNDVYKNNRKLKFASPPPPSPPPLPPNCEVMEVYALTYSLSEDFQSEVPISANNAVGLTELVNVYLPPSATNPDEVGEKIGLLFETRTNAVSINPCPAEYTNGMFFFDQFFDSSVGGGITRYKSSIYFSKYTLATGASCYSVSTSGYPITGGTGTYLSVAGSVDDVNYLQVGMNGYRVISLTICTPQQPTPPPPKSPKKNSKKKR